MHDLLLDDGRLGHDLLLDDVRLGHDLLLLDDARHDLLLHHSLNPLRNIRHGRRNERSRGGDLRGGLRGDSNQNGYRQNININI